MARRAFGGQVEGKSNLRGSRLLIGQTARQPFRPRRTGSRTRQRVSIIWSGAPLRQALLRLGSTQRRTVLLDRRVDPEMRLRLTVESQPFETVLLAIADRTNLQLDWIGPVAYLGPPKPAQRLSVVAASRRMVARELPADSRKRWLARNGLTWDVLGTPADLIRQLAHEAKAEVRQIERMPHDLWPAAKLPPLPLTDRLTLITYGFDLSFELNSRGDVVRLVPITAVPLSGVTEASRPPEESVSGARQRVGKRRQRAAEERYTLRIKDQPIGQLLEQLGQKLRLELVIDSESLDRQGIRLETRVSLYVRQVTLDQLLTALLRPAGLMHHRHGQTVHIEPLSK
ncbi:MAG: hypothetical protein ACC645_13920 [Pirellulales bacterium]